MREALSCSGGLLAVEGGWELLLLRTITKPGLSGPGWEWMGYRGVRDGLERGQWTMDKAMGDSRLLLLDPYRAPLLTPFVSALSEF